jgi:hypothetical protein
MEGYRAGLLGSLCQVFPEDNSVALREADPEVLVVVDPVPLLAAFGKVPETLLFGLGVFRGSRCRW